MVVWRTRGRSVAGGMRQPLSNWGFAGSMSHEKPPSCAAEQSKTDKTEEQPNHALANFHGDDQGDDTTQNNGGFHGWREFSRRDLCDNVHFHSCLLHSAATWRPPALSLVWKRAACQRGR